MGNCVTDVVSGLSALLEKLSPCCKGAEREARRIQRSGLGVQGQGASADWAVMPKGTKWEPATQGWQGLALAEGTTRGQPLPPSPGAGRTELVPGPVEKPSCIPWSSATCLVFCSTYRKEPRSLLHCTTPDPSARAVVADGTTWWARPAPTPRLSLRPGRATATGTRATSGPRAPRVWCQS